MERDALPQHASQITHFVRCSYGESMGAGELRHLSNILYGDTMVPHIE